MFDDLNATLDYRNRNGGGYTKQKEDIVGVSKF